MEKARTPAVPTAPHAAPDGTWGAFYQWAGACSVLFVVLLVVALVLDFIAPPPVHGGPATLEFIGRNKATYTAEQLLWTVPNILPVPVFAALFLALAPLGRSLALLAALTGGLSWALILAIPVTSRGSLVLVYLSDRYLEARDDAARLRYATAAEAVIAENNTPAVAGVLSAAGILLISVVMTRGVLPRAVAWLGIAAGGLGFAAEALRDVVPELYGGYGILMWAWFVAVGSALVRLGRRTRGGSGAVPAPRV